MSAIILKATGLGGAVEPIDRDEVMAGMKLLLCPDHAVQIQAIGEGTHYPVRHLHASDLGGIADTVIEWNAERKPRSIFFKINPTAADFDGMAKAGDILKRQNLFIDVDSRRPDDEAMNPASDQEKGASLLVAERIAGFLRAQGFAEPILSDSGNGWHLYYRIDMPNSEAARQAIRLFLKHVAAVYDDDAAKIGAECFNADRYSRIPGTWSRRGKPSASRPWRKCQLVRVPETWGLVTLEQIEEATLALAKMLAVPEAERRPSSRMILHATDSRLAAYVAAAFDGEREAVANARPGDRNNQLFRSSARLAEFVAGGYLNAEDTKEKLQAWAEMCGLEKGEIGPTIESGFKHGLQQPANVAEKLQETAAEVSEQGNETWRVVIGSEIVAEGKPAEIAHGFEVKAAQTRREFKVERLRNLLATEFPDPEWVVAGILSEGLNLLAGSPKSGKSMMALNLALTVAGGGMALGNVRTSPGSVLYLSLEDSRRRIKYRATRMAAIAGGSTPERMWVTTEWPRADQGGLGLMSRWVEQAAEPKLVIIDVLGKFRARQKERANQYQQDSDHLYQLKEWGDTHCLTTLVLHHTRKGAKTHDDDRDELEEVSGTQGIAGACDGVIVLRRARNSNEGRLHITGRDAPESKIVVEFQPDSLTWVYLGTHEEHLTGRFQDRLTKYMQARAGMIVFVKDIVRDLAANDSAVRGTLGRLAEKGIVQKMGNGWKFYKDEEGV